MTEIVGSSPTEKFVAQLADFGINPSKVHRNLSVEEMVSISVDRNEGVVNSTGSLSVNTGKYTGRSPDDRFIVYDDVTHDTIDWGKVNHQFPTGKFEKIFEKFRKPELKEIDSETTQPTIIGEEDATKPLSPLPEMITVGPISTGALELPQLIAGCGQSVGKHEQSGWHG